ncbi:MAG: hypothetical protein K0S39_2492, partial [Paenibacillus sp.]|nr:hypothetical protein [Paenibacillus sp.]
HGKSLVPLWQPNAGHEGDIRSRKEIIFGAYGGPVYCTDGDWMLVKKPVPGNAPLYWYTRSHYYNWEFGQHYFVEDNRDRLQQWDGQRFPTQYENAHPWHTPPRMIRRPEEFTANTPDPDDELYHIAEDEGQQRSLLAERMDVAERLRRRLSERMQAVDAPSEQWDRLGLTRQKGV